MTKLLHLACKCPESASVVTMVLLLKLATVTGVVLRCVFTCSVYFFWSTDGLMQCFSNFLLEWNSLERLDCSWNPRSDIRVCSIPNGQNHHFYVLSNLHEDAPIDTGVCV